MNNAARTLHVVAPVPVVKQPRKPRVVKRDALESMPAAEMSVVDQVWLATRSDNLLATFGGFLLGGFVPIATFAQAHSLGDQLLSNPLGLLVAGGLLFSCYTVFAWGRKAFGSALKAAGFVALVEGSMTFSQVHWVAYVALAFLVVINGIATGVNLALARWRAS